MQAKPSNISGWLVIDKPLGVSSAHVVAIVKRLVRPYGKPKVGHAGTLDPLASGVLPIAIGEATKLTQFLLDSSKEYSFDVTWGEERDTDDAEGKVVASSGLQVAGEDIEKILPNFRGDILQVPPQYSAIKMGGERAYDMARAGQEFKIEARHVKIYSLELKQENGNSASFELHCSKGTYVRSLARDIGRELGAYGYVSRLERGRHGQFTENSAITLDKLEEFCKRGALAEVMLPLHEVLDGIPALQLSEEEEKKIRFGMALDRESKDDLVALFSGNTLVALATPLDGKLQPKRVFN